jgi:cytochrome bd-type quinol oxidase subunit 2
MQRDVAGAGRRRAVRGVFRGLTLVAGYALLGAAWVIWRAEGGLQSWAFRLAKTLLVIVIGGMLAVSLWPYVVPPSLTLWEASAPPEGQVFLLAGMMILIPTILACTAFNYWVFRGKATHLDHHH